MKKCPNCQKTFDDNMKFCQSDGTPLVVVADNKPEADPYATMIAKKSDLEVPPAEPKEEVKEEPKVEVDPYATMVAPIQPKKEVLNEDDDNILEILDDDSKDEEIDPMKTMVVSGSTADNIKVNIPDEKPKEQPKNKPTPDEASEAQTIISPDIPKFNEPKVNPPNLDDIKIKTENKEPAQEVKKKTPSSPFDSKPKSEDRDSAPIPSPFDDSMPPGYAPPSTPPFEPPKEPLKPEPLNEVKKEEPPKTPFAESKKPVVESKNKDFDPPSAAFSGVDNKIQNLDSSSGNALASDSPAANQEKNMILAIVALVTGILGFCCGPLGLVGVVTGFMAKNKVDAEPELYSGRGLALAGMIIGAIGFLLNVIFGIIYTLLNFS